MIRNWKKLEHFCRKSIQRKAWLVSSANTTNLHLKESWDLSSTRKCWRLKQKTFFILNEWKHFLIKK